MKKHASTVLASRLAVAIATVPGILVGFSAHADVKYTESVQMAASGKPTGDHSGAEGMANSTTTYIKDGAQRVETSMQYGPVKMNTIMLTVCAKKQIFQIDPELKIYTATSLSGGSGSAGSNGKAAGAAPAKDAEGKKGTGKITITSSVKSLGEETVSNRKCRHYLVDMQTKMEGCAGTGDTHSKMEIWVADYKMPVFDCGGQPYQAGAYGHDSSECSIATEQKGDTQQLTEAYRGLIMRMKMYSGGEGGGDNVITREVTALSEAKLDDALFAVPADYKLVAEREFQDQHSKAMMKAIMSAATAGEQDGENNGDAAHDNSKDGKDEDGGNAGQNDGDTGDTEAAKEKPKKPKKPRGFKLPF